jgi:hypothetical protein
MQSSIILLVLLAFVIPPAFAYTIIESDGTQTSLEKALHFDDTQLSQIVYGTLNMGQRHYYTFDAAKGEKVHFEILIPLIEGNENYKPTAAFYKEGSELKEFIRYKPPFYFDEIPAQRLSFYEPFGQANWFMNQDETREIAETGTYVIEIFDEGECVVVEGINVEKKCLPEYFSVKQGKYAFVMGTVDEATPQDQITRWFQTREFFNDSIEMKWVALFLGIAVIIILTFTMRKK